jgi:hypothetical protein
MASGDHLLPKQLYPHLAQCVDNLVPCCSHCNRMKQDYDPSEGKGDWIVITESVRRIFIEGVKSYIARKKSEHARDFATGKAPFARALAEFRG